MIRRANRFHGHKSVARLRGSVVHSQNLSARFQKSNSSDYRLAVVVSKKVASSAVKRNRIRRRIFEQIRTQGRLNNLPVDLVLYVKNDSLATNDSKDLEKEVGEITKKVLSRLT